MRSAMTTKTFKHEILFVDPGAPDLETIFAALRPEVEAILLDATRPAAQQMAEALAGRRNLAAIHVIAHGSPSRVAFSSGEWSLRTIARDAHQLRRIGHALS